MSLPLSLFLPEIIKNREQKVALWKTACSKQWDMLTYTAAETFCHFKNVLNTLCQAEC